MDTSRKKIALSWGGRWHLLSPEKPSSPAQIEKPDLAHEPSRPAAPSPFIADTPVDKDPEYGDSFGFEPRVNQLTEALTRQNGSFRLGVMGPWGSGKSSFCHMMKRQLEGDKIPGGKRAVVWFDASQYQQDEKPLLALLATIFETLDKVEMSGMSARLKNSLDEVTQGFGALLKAMKFRTDLNVGLWKASMEVDPKKASDNVKAAREAKVLHALDNEISQYDSLSPWIKELEKALQKIKAGELQLFIFIDDLDRCPWRKALTLLEQVKVILDLPHCVFVFALNKKIIFQFIKERFSDKGLEAGFTPQQYFEKIVDLSVDVPRPQGNLEQFACGLMQGRSGWLHQDWHADLAKVLSLASHGNPRTLIKMLNQLLGKLVVEPPELGDMVTGREQTERLLFEVCLEVLVPQLHFELKHHRLSRDYLQSLMQGSSHQVVRINDFLLDFEVADKLDAVRELLLDKNFTRWVTFLNFNDLQTPAAAEDAYPLEIQPDLPDNEEGFGDVRLNRPRFLQLKHLQTQKAQRQVLDLLDVYLNRFERHHWENNARNIREILGLLSSFHSYQQVETFCYGFLVRLTQVLITTGTDGKLEARVKDFPFSTTHALFEIPQVCRALCEKVRLGLSDRKLTALYLQMELVLDTFFLIGNSEKIPPMLFRHESMFDLLAVHDEVRKSGELFYYAFTLYKAFDRWIKTMREQHETLANERIFESASRLKTFVLARGKSEIELGNLFLSGSKDLGQRRTRGPLEHSESELSLSLSLEPDKKPE